MLIHVRSDSELANAIRSAGSGDTIQLSAGNYSALSIENKHFSAGLNVVADASAGPVNVSALNISGSSGINISGFSVGHARSHGEKASSVQSFIDDGSSRINITDVDFHGSLNGNPADDAVLLRVLDSSDVVISHSSFVEATRGLIVERSDSVSITGNDVHTIRTDGMDFIAVRNVDISGNRISNFKPAHGDHPDGIQFWTAGQTRASENIRITDNILLQGTGAPFQGIFMGEEAGNLPYKNVTIDNNLIYTAGPSRGQAGIWHGISLYHGLDSAITNNSVLSSTRDAYDTRISLYRSSSVTLSGNVTDNLFVQSSSDLASHDNHSLRSESWFAPRIPNLNAGAAARDADLVVAGVGYHPGGSQPAPGAPPASGTHMIYGTDRSDTIAGTSRADTISGVAKSSGNRGRHTVDVLSGQGGPDVFLLGDGHGSYYDDGNKYNNGRQDYALIKDFAEGDKIQLSGERSDYIFVHTVQEGVSGLGIFQDSNENGAFDAKDELIAHIAGLHVLGTNAIDFAAVNAAGGAVGQAIGQAISDILAAAGGATVNDDATIPIADPRLNATANPPAAGYSAQWLDHAAAIHAHHLLAHLVTNHFVALP